MAIRTLIVVITILMFSLAITMIVVTVSIAHEGLAAGMLSVC